MTTPQEVRVKFEGATLRLGERTYVVPPLTFKDLRKLLPKIQKLGGMTQVTDIGSVSDEQMEAVVEVVHAAFLRNYPDLTKDEVEEFIDMRNIQKLLPVIMGSSGFEMEGKGPASEAAVAAT